jgi:parallel beta-helix repeat protein
MNKLFKTCLSLMIIFSFSSSAVYPQMNTANRGEGKRKEIRLARVDNPDLGVGGVSEIKAFFDLKIKAFELTRASYSNSFERPSGGFPNTVTNLNDSGPGSLRQAIEDAEDFSTIVFDDGLTGTLELTSGSLVIDKSIDIIGPGPRNLTIDSGLLAEGSVIVIKAPEPAPPDAKAFSLRNSGLASPSGEMTQVFVTVEGLTLVGGKGTPDSTVKSLAGGGIYADIPFGIPSALGIFNCSIRDNSAGIGGGLSLRGLGLTFVLNTTISGNIATENGGGVFIDQNGDTILINATVSGNLALGNGGGFYRSALNQVVGLGATTISANTAGLSGGGIYTEFDSAPPIVGEIPTGDGPPEIGVVLLLSSIVAGNALLADDLAERPAITQFPDVDGAFNAAFSLVGVVDGSIGIIDGVDGNIIGDLDNPLDAFLAPLANNGGPTDTMALLGKSPAIDAGVLVDPKSSTDQRGAPRPWYPNLAGPPPGPGPDGSDMGAYEYSFTTASRVSLEGRVMDQIGRSIKGARVSVNDIEAGQIYTVQTNQFGRYSVRGLTAGGTFVVSVSAKSSAEREVQIISLADSLTNFNFVLNLTNR